MSIYHGLLNKSDKTDLSDIERRLKALETLTATMNFNVKSNKTAITTVDATAITAKTNYLANKTDIATNTSNIGAASALIAGNRTNINNNTSDISTNKNNITVAYDKATRNGDKILKKIAFMQNFDFHFTNPTVGSFNDADSLIGGYPSVYAPLLHRTADTTIHIQLHVFDSDVTLDATEKAEYRIDFLKNDGNSISWDSPTQTISSGRILTTVYEVDVKMTLGAFSSDWDLFRAFKFHYKPVIPTKVNGNESVVSVCVYSA